MNHVFFLLTSDFLGLDSNESISCRFNVATAWSSRSRFECRPSTYNLNRIRTWPSATRSDCLHISKPWRNHHRKHIAKISSHFAFMSTSIANCKSLFFLLYAYLFLHHSQHFSAHFDISPFRFADVSVSF